MQEIHEAVLQTLLDIRNQNPEFYFTLRMSNRSGRLDEGYWFHGNENYLAISFWRGTDWKNKTPNIFFRILKSGETHLELTAKDSEKKWSYFNKYLKSDIDGLKNYGKRKLIKPFPEFGNHYITSLISFLENDKVLIDKSLKNVTEELKKEVFTSSSNTLGFIEKDFFIARLERILKYRQTFIKNTRADLPISINFFEIKNYPPIKSIRIDHLLPKNQWIFFTGMNGTGKSSLLKALTIAITNNSDYGKIIENEHQFNIKLSLNKYGKTEDYSIIKNKYEPKIYSNAFAAYGAARQMVDESDSNERLNLTYSIFNNDGLLLDLSSQLRSLNMKNHPRDIVGEERIDQIVELLADIIPSLVDIELPKKTLEGIWSKTQYIEEDENENRLEPVEFNQLASGVKSLVAMIGDMCSRLYSQQPEISDPSELTGIVIIDELDIHLHPILQKKIVELLSTTFINVQFIASTHSPIPFLGAPKDSVIFNVTRTRKKGVEVKRLKNIQYQNLLPNALLTSPVFGMEELKPSSNKDIKKVITDDHYDEKEFFNLIDRKIKELEDDLED